MTCHCPSDLTFQWQPYSDGHVFQNVNILYIKQKLSSFEPILGGFGGFGPIQKSKMADQDGRHTEMITHLLPHVKRSPHDADAPFTLEVSELQKGEESPPPPSHRRPCGRTPKNLGLNRV